jgi:hypothetical protein
MLFRETSDDYCENHTEHTNTLCGQNAEFWYVKAGGIYTLYRALIRSVMTYACSTWEYAADTHLMKLQRLQNRVLQAGAHRSANCAQLSKLLTCTTI